MPATPTTRRRVELFLVPLVAALCMAFIIGAIVLNRDGRPCSQPTWNNHLSLSLAGSFTGISNVSAVTACLGVDCVPAPPAVAKSASGNSRVLTAQDDGSWLLTVGAQPPTGVSVQAYDRSGHVVASQSTSLNWTRVSGDERCGGRMAGLNMKLSIP